MFVASGSKQRSAAATRKAIFNKSLQVPRAPARQQSKAAPMQARQRKGYKRPFMTNGKMKQ